MKKLGIPLKKKREIIIFLGFDDDLQLKRLLRFLDTHGFRVYAVNDVEEMLFHPGHEREESEKPSDTSKTQKDV